MGLALRLARKGLGATSPNPAVGAVVAGGGAILGTGWHRRAGTEHAEVLALRESGGAAAGATLYVTLEPCAHHGRTPPCVEAVIASRVARVVVAMEDPDARVAGKGIAALREAGIGVDIGVGSAAAEELNEAYVLHRRRGRPYVTYKAAATLDGATAAADGTSRWITGPASRRDVHRVRAASDAICVGVGTVLADDPSLTVRLPATGPHGTRPPLLRVVVDSVARTPPGSRVLGPGAPTLIAVTEAAPPAQREALLGAGAEVVAFPAESGRVPVRSLLQELGRRGIVALLLEGGATLAGSFVDAGLVDRVLLYVAPALLGDGSAGVVRGWAAPTIGEARHLTLRSVRRMGDDVRVEAVRRGDQPGAAPGLLPERGS